MMVAQNWVKAVDVIRMIRSQIQLKVQLLGFPEDLDVRSKKKLVVQDDNGDFGLRQWKQTIVIY